MAGDKKNKEALYRLGKYYERVDEYKAKKYYEKSLELGNRKAAEKVFSQTKKKLNLEDYNFHISHGVGLGLGGYSSNYMNNSYER